MWTDPIVEEVRAAGDKLARECGYDLHKLCEVLRAKEREHPERIVRLQPKRLEKLRKKEEP